jgi:hypothetical protein
MDPLTSASATDKTLLGAVFIGPPLLVLGGFIMAGVKGWWWLLYPPAAFLSVGAAFAVTIGSASAVSGKSIHLP